MNSLAKDNREVAEADGKEGTTSLSPTPHVTPRLLGGGFVGERWSGRPGLLVSSDTSIVELLRKYRAKE